MAELIDVANALFTNKNNWKNISDEDKEIRRTRFLRNDG